MRLFSFTLVRVDGTNMGRTLPQGTLALFRSHRSARKGDVALVDHPQFGLIIKEVAAVSLNGKPGLRGMSSLSCEGEVLTHVERDQIKGVLIWQL